MVSQVGLMRRASDCHFSLGASACSFCIVVPDSRALFFACTLSSSSDHFFGSFVLNNFLLKKFDSIFVGSFYNRLTIVTLIGSYNKRTVIITNILSIY